MERPEKIYLDSPVIIDGFTINYTLQGLEYLIHHYEHVQATKAHSMQSPEIKEHLINMLSQLNHFKFLYTKQ